MKASKILIAATLILSSMLTVYAEEAAKPASELNADEVEYDMNTGVATATGNVLLKYDNGVATGDKAMYNINTKEAYLIGNVIVVRENMKLTCDKLLSDGSNYMQVDGNVHAEQKVAPNEEKPQGDLRTFTGEHVDYYPNDGKHVIIPTGGIAKSNDGTFTADHMEGWLDDEYYIGTGNAHLVSPPRNIEAGGDRVDYYGKEQGKAILTGNAWAYQNNNTLKGNRLTVYLADDKKLKAVPTEETKPTNAAPNLTTDKPFGEATSAEIKESAKNPAEIKTENLEADKNKH